jgi:hypothetical protein
MLRGLKGTNICVGSMPLTLLNFPRLHRCNCHSHATTSGYQFSKDENNNYTTFSYVEHIIGFVISQGCQEYTMCVDFGNTV